jgi:hypothetical protein
VLNFVRQIRHAAAADPFEEG